MNKITVTYDELFQLMEFNHSDYNNSQFNDKNIFVDTPTGLTKIKAGVIKPKLDMVNIKFEDLTECNVADTHIFSYNNKEIFAKDASIVDTRTNQLKIIEKTDIGKHDGYDINIDDPHWYYSHNHVIYHNSLFMTDIISGMIKNNKNVLLVSLEMTDKEVMKRVHSNAMDLPVNALSDLSKTPGELEKITGRSIVNKEQVIAAYNKMKTSGTCGKFFVKDYPAGSFSALMLEQVIESFKIEKGIDFDMVFVDYLGIMKSDLLSPAAGLYSYIKSIGEEVRAVATKQQIPIISASQLNRSATNNTEDADNSNISDSMGSAMTADFMLFLLQNEEMKARNEIVCKCTKNRFAGMTDVWLMQIDYEHMRFNDMLIQKNDEITNLEVTDTLGLNSKSSSLDDFGIITKDKQKNAEEFAHQEVKSIVQNDQKILSENKDNPFDESIDDIFAELGI